MRKKRKEMAGKKKSKSKDHPHVCQQCGKSFPFNSTLRYHERIHNGERPYKCQYCDKTFAQKSTQTIHERRHTGDRPYQCSYCDKAFASQGNMKIHERQHTGYKPYACPTCQKRFATIGGLRTHEATHEASAASGERVHQYPCDQCDKVYAHRASLYVHKKQRHSGGTATASPNSSTDGNEGSKDKLIVDEEESKKKLACQYCGKRFAYRHPLLAHERTHTGERPYQCHFCPKAFAQQASLVMHERVHTGERRYQCDVCEKRFIQAAALHAHKRTHTGERPYQCKLCPKAFAHATSLRQHQTVHARRAALEQRQQSSETESNQESIQDADPNSSQSKKAHVCVCGKEFAYRSLLEVHARTHTKPFVCSFCQRHFSQKAALQSHERTHTGERRSYPCPTCGKTLSSASALHTHKKTHGPRSYRCPSCPKTFTLRTYLRLHMRQVHTKTGKIYACPLCGKEFSYAGSVQVHIRTHTGERPYVCKYCPKAFASQGNLQSHERTHTGVRPYCCDTCGRCFAQRTQLSVHEATHVNAGEKIASPRLSGTEADQSQDQSLSVVRSVADYPCTVCGKRFAYASSLCVHMRLHTGERPYACRYCSKRFTNQGNMRVHERVHTGERPFKCPACDKRYAQKVGLRMHLDQCQQYLTAKVGGEEQSNGGADNSVKAQKKQRLENLLPKLYSKKVPLMKPRRLGMSDNSNALSLENQPMSILPTMVLPMENSIPSSEAEINIPQVSAGRDDLAVKEEIGDDLVAERDEACVPSLVAGVPKGENMENDTDALSLYAAQMQKEFESCLMSLNADQT